MPERIETGRMLIRADAGGILGTGHVMRMIALAQAWQDRGGGVTLAACQCPAALVERLRAENIGYRHLGPLPLGAEEDLRQTLDLGKALETAWVVLDGYHFGGDYQQAVRAHGFKVLAVDDYGHCDTWQVDCLLNQNLGAEASEPVVHSEGSHSRVLMGPKFALLRREFRKRAALQPIPAAERTRILITFGGVDPTGAAVRVLRVLNGLPGQALDLRILAGPANPNLAALRREVAESPHQIELIPTCDDMPSLYHWAERVISAGGSSCYEWMFFGLPGWVTSIAPNQRRIVKAMLDDGIAAGVEDIALSGESELSRSLARWLEAPLPAQTTIVDGWGALRVAAAMAAVPCWVRPVDAKSDARFLFDLANEPSVRAAGRHPREIHWDEHLKWLERHCGSPQSRLLMVEMLDEGPVGQVRFHELGDRVWELGISIHPRQRRAGLAAAACALAMRDGAAGVAVGTWLAHIRCGNEASQRLFAKLGFTRESEMDGLQTWILPTPPR